MNTSKLALFTDCSVNPKSGVGVGGFLELPFSVIDAEISKDKLFLLREKIKFIVLTETTSTKLEVQTAIKALEQAGTGQNEIILFTDSQNVAGLLGRRERLEKSNFIGKRSGVEIKNADLYKKFYQLHDILKFSVEKVKGHVKSSRRNKIENIFSVVDRGVRKYLKEQI